MFIKLPSWMIPGAQFRDPFGDKCIYLGFQKWRDTEYVPILVGDHKVGNVLQLQFRPQEHVFVYLYKGEWHMGSFDKDPGDYDEEYFSSCKQGWKDSEGDKPLVLNDQEKKLILYMRNQ